MPVMPLLDALKSIEDFKIPKDIHFCKIDVEGFEKEVIEGIDFSKIKPWIFAIESNVPLSKKPAYGTWEHTILDNGYVFVCSQGNPSHGINRYYVDSKHSDLIDSRKSIAQIKNENYMFKAIPYDAWRLVNAAYRMFNPLIVPIYKAIKRR